jgi:hypothetical protein
MRLQHTTQMDGRAPHARGCPHRLLPFQHVQFALVRPVLSATNVTVSYRDCSVRTTVSQRMKVSLPDRNEGEFRERPRLRRWIEVPPGRCSMLRKVLTSPT